MLSYSKIVYVHLDRLVYEDIDILIILRMAREHVDYSVHMPILSTYNNLKSLVIHNSSVVGHTEKHAVAIRDCALPVQAWLNIVGTNVLL